ncbi:MAG: sialate O-acetylesterase [Aureliella sp.]
MTQKITFIWLAIFFSAHAAIAQEHSRPLKVFILAGQSNMQGHAQVSTFDYLADDPKTATLLQEMRDADGKPKVCNQVWITSVGCLGNAYSDLSEKKGKLTVGFGAPDDKIGPEFTFGITMEKLLDEPILIIKTAWGGRSLHTDFRPPSAGPYELSTFQLENYPKQQGHGIPKDFEQWKVERVKETGVYYRHMIDHIRTVLKDIKRCYPDYDPAQDFELAGFVWLQGFNDMVDSHTYPNSHEPGGYDLYTNLLAHLIRDVRKDLEAPQMPFVIGVMGVDGIQEKPNYFRQAMAAPAAMPEFKGNVIAVETAPFWDQKLGEIDKNHGKVQQMSWMLETKDKNGPNEDGKLTKQQQEAYLVEYQAKLISPEDELIWKRGASNGGYHYLGCAKTFALMGQAFAEALLTIKSLTPEAKP